MSIYIGNLSYQVTQEDIIAVFSEYGNVKQVSLPTDRETGRLRGFCFVEMETPAEEAAAIAGGTQSAHRSVMEVDRLFRKDPVHGSSAFEARSAFFASGEFHLRISWWVARPSKEVLYVSSTDVGSRQAWNLRHPSVVRPKPSLSRIVVLTGFRCTLFLVVRS